jgi:cytosine deaminase
MCSGAVLLYKIPRVIIGENRTFQGPENYLRARGVVLVVVDNAECVGLMQEFIRQYPHLWNEDIGEPGGLPGVHTDAPGANLLVMRPRLD